MMGPGDGYPGHVHAHHSTHHPMPMDLHVPQGFPYYRYRNEAFCWPERKPGVDDMTGQGSMHPRQAFDQTGRFPPATQAMPILELRKEKSRDAARSRRGKENYEFYELAKMLPLPPAITSQLDKASIIRLTISYLKLKDFSAHGDPPWLRDTPSPNKKGSGRPRSSGNTTLDLFEQHQGTHILQSLDGFAFSLAADGRFLYISETVSIYLGLSQVEMTGSSVFDYIHQGDHAELAEQLGLGLAHGPGANVPSPSGSEDGSSNSATNNPDVSSVMSINSNLGYKGLDRAFCIRMKSTLTKRGCHFKSSGYRVVLVLCRLRPQYSFSHTRKAPPPLLGMVALAIALPPPSVHEIRLESDMFVTRLTFDFKVIHCEPRVSELLDYTSEELTGRNLYALCHAEDVNKLRKCHVDLLSKGQVMSQYYRVMNKNGGWTWIQSCATVVCSTKNSDEQNIICVNYVLSGPEDPHVVMDCCQLEQDIPPAVKREVIDDRDRKTPDRDSSDGSGRGRDGPVGSHHLDSTRSPGARSSAAGSERSPEIRDGAPPRERRVNLHQKPSASSNRLSDSSIPTLPETQPLTPVQTSTPDHLEARTPQSVRSMDSEPFTNPIPMSGKSAPAATGTKGRKRKLDRTNQNVTRVATTSNSLVNGVEVGPMHLAPAGAPHGHHATHNHSTPCSKRQIIVQNEVMDGSGLVNGGGSGTPGSGAAENGTSPHHSNEADNSGDSIRWRKNHSQQHWESSGGSSVKDLEHVMSKHLPGRDNEHAPIVTSGIDFSADSLLRQQPGSRNGSAIQWVGPGSQTGSGLPVSALLRQLCASRESVIRANVQAAAAAAVVAARGASSYYPDMGTVQSALPTPPGSDNYGESQFMLSSHHPTHKQTSSGDFPPLVPYSTVSSYDYQPAMTPPASVSPRDKPSYSSSTSDPSITYGDPSISNSTSFRPPQSYLDGPAQPLPLKPQVYGYHPHSALESQYGNSLADHGHGQSQFYPPPHTSFHLYHPTKQTYGDALKNANWYSTAS